MAVPFFLGDAKTRARPRFPGGWRGFSRVRALLAALVWLGGALPALAEAPVGGAAPAPAAPGVAGHPAHSDPAATPDLSALTAQLAAASSRAAAADLEVRLEQARRHALSPTTRLLQRGAQAHLVEGKALAAVEDLDDALVLQPDVAILWRDRAQARLAARDLTGAITDLGVALQRDGQDAVAWRLLSAVEEQRGDWQAAERAWQRVMALDPMVEGGRAKGEQLHLKAFGRPT
ncbi:hypothetical protein HLH27_00530 [Gluconacetobacter takamatsuzukensis]|uniref:Tetratricopeptide repeat protein n=1 Tax=Gluconacetobacter takamatsuzukensis TaxID=1286190 RepID=A0A7W4KAS1_9PROT|nr:hypothetical protein [Gluconacetobacter takamatsuzukensis]